jgi:hypothetical protein
VAQSAFRYNDQVLDGGTNARKVDDRLFSDCGEWNYAILQHVNVVQGAIAEMSYQDLINDPDFTRAVKSTFQECTVNVNVFKVFC